MNSILEPLKQIRDNGFINYSSNLYFGLSMSNSLGFSRAFLEGRYSACFLHHFFCLAQSSRECTHALHRFREKLLAIGDSSIVGSQRNQHFEWKTFLATIESFVDQEKHHCSLTNASASDIDLNPLNTLVELTKHIEQHQGDCRAAMLMGNVNDNNNTNEDNISFLLPEPIIRWHLKSLSDLYFNTLASVRIRKSNGNSSSISDMFKVQVGDIVCTDETLLNKLDPIQTPSFTVPYSNTLTFNRENADPLASLLKDNRENNNNNSQSSVLLFKTIESESEAKQYKATQIVLPKWGYFSPDLLSALASQPQQQERLEGKSSEKHDNRHTDSVAARFLWPSSLPLPSHNITPAMCTQIASALKLPSALSPNSAVSQTIYQHLVPRITYRPLFAKPQWMFAHCWDSRASSSSSVSQNGMSEPNFGLGPTMHHSTNPNFFVVPTELDIDGWRRILTIGANQEAEEKRMSGEEDFSALLAKNKKPKIDDILADDSPKNIKVSNHRVDVPISQLISPPRFRPAVRGPEARQLLTAGVPQKAITTAIRVALPAGVCLTSLLREVYQVHVFKQRDVSDRIAETVKHSQYEKREKFIKYDRKLRRDAEKKSMDF
jgi:hypothetical protein